MMTKSTSGPKASRHFSSSILLWVRTDQPRQTGMDYWRGPHSGIISATPGLLEYRQIHLAEANPGLWPATAGLETQIPDDRKIDGVAEVTFQSLVAPLLGRKQTKLAYADEVNVFRRTLLNAGPPGSSRWYDVGEPGTRAGSRVLIYLRRRPGVKAGAFRKYVHGELIPALANAAALEELRSQVFLPWQKKLWDTPNVAHDNPKGQRLHAALMLGFAGPSEAAAFFGGDEIKALSTSLAGVASAAHAYDVSDGLTYVRSGEILPHYES